MQEALKVLFYISIILTVVSLVISLFTVLLYAKIRKFSDNPYNLMISSLIICEIIMSIHILIAIIFNDVEYQIVCQIDGVIAFFTYNAGAMYYWSLSHLILRLDFQKNSAAITTQFYHIVSVAYGAISSIFALACGDIEPSPIGTCAIEAGSFSDLFPIIVMFLIFPYSIFTLFKVLINRKRGLKSIFVVQINVHLFNVIAFFVGWLPITFAHVYTYLAQDYPSDVVTKICFLFYCASGMLNSLLRLPADPSLRKAAANVLCCRKRDNRTLSISSRKQSSMHFLRSNGKSYGEAFLSGKPQEPVDDFTQKSQIRIYTTNVITLSGAFLSIQDTYRAAEENSQLKRVIDYASVE